VEYTRLPGDGAADVDFHKAGGFEALANPVRGVEVDPKRLASDALCEIHPPEGHLQEPRLAGK
jgi:hypothetical protein